MGQNLIDDKHRLFHIIYPTLGPEVEGKGRNLKVYGDCIELYLLFPSKETINEGGISFSRKTPIIKNAVTNYFYLCTILALK